MKRLVVAFILIMTSILVPAITRLPAVVLASCMIVLFYRSRFFSVLLRFLLIWFCFYAGVGAARFFAGTELKSLIIDGVSGLGLALGISCSLLLIATGPPGEILYGFDRLKVPRDISYAFLSLLRLLPQIKTLGSRQLALLELKGILGGGIGQRFRAYRRITGPLFIILLTQQFNHARGLQLRGFFDSRLPELPIESRFRFREILLLSLLILNAAFWYGVSLWK
jgi:energy-coupling factor transporter transmembrane protein EcfT